MKRSAPERGARREGSGHGRARNLRAAHLAAILGLLLFALPASAQDAITLLSGVSAASGASVAVKTGNASAVEIQAWSASTSTSTILIQQSLDGTTWYTIPNITITNVSSATGALCIGPPAPWTRVTYTRSAGTLTVKLVTLESAKNVTGWKTL
jgi:hypothetical protein